MSHTILTDILIIFAVAVPTAFVFHKLKLPPIIGFLVTGAVIGPAGLGLIHDTNRINILAQVGVALLVFSIGLEFSLKHFKEVRAVAIGGGILQIILTTIIIIAISLALGLNFNEGLFLGMALSLSSTAIVYHILSNASMVDSPHGRISTGMLILQDLSAIPMIAILPVFLSASTGNFGTVSYLTAFLNTAIVAIVFFAGSKYIFPKFFHQITMTRSKELFLISILAFALGFGLLTDSLGLSFALGAFLAGLSIAETDFRFHALSEISPFRYCFNGLFFVSIGMLVHPEFFSRNWIMIPLIAVAIPFLKAFITAVIIFFFCYPLTVAAMAGLALSQVGEFSFLVAFVANKTGAISPFLYDLTIASAFITILATPLIMSLSPHIAKLLEKFPSFGKKNISPPAELKDHVVICGFGPLGGSVGHILQQAEKEFIVLELNPATVRKLKNTGHPVYLGDGASAEILYKSGIEKANVLAVTAPDYMNNIAIIKQARAMNAGLKIITRAKFRNQVADLYSAGADVVISEELEAGIEMSRYILLNSGIDETAIEQYAQSVRAFGSADFF